MQKSKKGNVAILAVAVIVLAASFVALWLVFRQQPVEGVKSISLEVSAREEIIYSEELRTDLSYLRELLEYLGLVSPNEPSFISTIGGRTADTSLEEWWFLSKNGYMLTTGADEAVLEDGDSFEITLRVGFDFD